MALYTNWVYPFGFPAKIEATNNAQFKNKCFWTDGVITYNDVIYCYVSESRPQFQIEREIVKNNFGENNIIFQSKIERYKFDFIANSSMVDVWSSIQMHDVIKLTHIERGKSVFLKNIEFVDNTQGIDQGTISLIGELSIVLDRKCDDSDVLPVSCS